MLQRSEVLMAAIFGLTGVMTQRECTAVVAPQVYWSESVHGIVSANEDGSNATSIRSQPASKMAVDGRTGSVYLSTSSGVHRIDSDGESIDLFELQERTLFTGIALDQLNNHVFVVEAFTSTIYRLDLDGGNATVVIPSDGMSANLTRIDDLRIDPIGGKLYWSNVCNNSFNRSNLDGSGQEELFTFPGFIHDFDIDPRNDLVYWSRWGFVRDGGAILRANFDGSQEVALISDGLWGVYGLSLDLDGGQMYFADYWTRGPTNYDGTIRKANIDGSMVSVIANLGPANRVITVAVPQHIIPEPSALVIAFLGLGGCAITRTAR